MDVSSLDFRLDQNGPQQQLAGSILTAFGIIHAHRIPKLFIRSASSFAVDCTAHRSAASHGRPTTSRAYASLSPVRSGPRRCLSYCTCLARQRPSLSEHNHKLALSDYYIEARWFNTQVHNPHMVCIRRRDSGREDAYI
jgi:hypothetical protein